jgi:hypothetical protein
LDVPVAPPATWAIKKAVSFVKKNHRRVVVLTTLVSVLTLTSALLLALAPAPLTPDATNRLFAIETPQTMDVIFQTDTPMRTGRWKYIYVHHSTTTAGNALSLAQGTAGVADHFIIGNGDGSVDGELQIGPRWTAQSEAGAPKGATSIDPDCISICLIGDFERGVPTPTQLRRLEQLVGALQGRLRISASNIVLSDAASAAGVGRYFPQTAFREQLLP